LSENDIKRVTRKGENLWKGAKKIYRGPRLAALGREGRRRLAFLIWSLKEPVKPNQPKSGKNFMLFFVDERKGHPIYSNGLRTWERRCST
jgi:hypothetical protein